MALGQGFFVRRSGWSAEAVTVYPNPATGRATVLVPGVAGASALKLALSNALGQVVYTETAGATTATKRLTLD